MKYNQVKSLFINRKMFICVSNLTPEQKAKLQLDLFRIGVRWASGKTRIFNPALESDVNYYVVNERHELCYDHMFPFKDGLDPKRALNELRYRVFLH